MPAPRRSPRGGCAVGARAGPDLARAGDRADSRAAERAVLALVAFGLVDRRDAPGHAASRCSGIVLVENGLALAALELPGGASLAIELGVALDLMLDRARRGGLPRADLRRVRRGRHAPRWERFVTSRETARRRRGRSPRSRRWSLLASRPRRRVDRASRVAGGRRRPRRSRVALAVARARRPAATRGRRLARRRRRRRAAGRGDRHRRPRERCSCRRRTSPPAAARSSRPERRAADLLRRALRVLGGAARRPARRQPRCRLAPRRGDHRRVGAPRRLQRQAARARGGLEVPDPHLARARVALLGIVLLAAGVPGGGLERLSWRALPRLRRRRETALVAYLLLLAGLAAKIGWAPVHNWLPDAHSEAPPPVSALLSAALLPAVLLVAWRSEHALAPARRRPDGRGRCSIGFGLVSLAVAVPFLWRPLAVEAAARLLEPRAHGRDRARDRLRDAARARRRRGPHRRPRDRQGARLLRRDAAARARAARRRRTPSPASRARSRRSARRWASRSARSPGCRRRRSSSARC